MVSALAAEGKGAEMISSVDLVRELHSATCPTCLGPKVKRTHFCNSCYRVLPAHMAQSLRLPIGNGREKAYDEAKRCVRQRRATASDVGAGRHTRA